jgi:putative ABC transport system ATP-binding protein
MVAVKGARSTQSQTEAAAAIRVADVHRVYHLAGEDIHALRGVSLEIQPAQMTAIIGRSGSGKTTFLNLIGGLDAPSEGQIWIGERELTAMTEKQRLNLRRDHFGFIFQAFGLLPLLTAEENVSVPLRMRRMNRSERVQRVAEALEWVGLSDRAKHRPYELSGGEQQRVAIARAVAARPEIIFADEPTGQLDSQTGGGILTILRRLVEELGTTMVIVSHDPNVKEEADVVHELRDGEVIDTLYKGIVQGTTP